MCLFDFVAILETLLSSTCICDSLHALLVNVNMFGIKMVRIDDACTCLGGLRPQIWILEPLFIAIHIAR